MRCAFQDLAGYPRILDNVDDLRPLRGWHAYKDPLEVGPARLLAAMLRDVGVSTLRSIKTMTQFSSPFGASNQPCCLLQCSGTTLRVHLRRPLVFLVVSTYWELVSPHIATRSTFFPLFLFWTIIPAILPAMMLRYYS
jgi:hypothetical protein